MAQHGCHGGPQHEGQLDQLMRQEVAVVIVQAGQLRHLHQPGACQMNQEEKREQKKRNRGENREQEGQKLRLLLCRQNSCAQCPAWWRRRRQKMKRQKMKRQMEKMDEKMEEKKKKQVKEEEERDEEGE